MTGLPTWTASESPKGTEPSVCSVLGLTTASGARPVAGTQQPPMKNLEVSVSRTLPSHAQSKTGPSVRLRLSS